MFHVATILGIKANEAYSKGDIKGGNVELGKGMGSIAGGAAGGIVAGLAVKSAILVFGVATGGTGLVLIGLAAAVGYGMGKGGEAAGELIANGVNWVAFND